MDKKSCRAVLCFISHFSARYRSSIRTPTLGKDSSTIRKNISLATSLRTILPWRKKQRREVRCPWSKLVSTGKETRPWLRGRVRGRRWRILRYLGGVPKVSNWATIICRKNQKTSDMIRLCRKLQGLKRQRLSGDDISLKPTISRSRLPFPWTFKTSSLTISSKTNTKLRQSSNPSATLWNRQASTTISKKHKTFFRIKIRNLKPSWLRNYLLMKLSSPKWSWRLESRKTNYDSVHLCLKDQLYLASTRSKFYPFLNLALIVD